MNEYNPSLFDRLTDPSLLQGQCRYSAHQLEQSVIRDLCELLNTKRPPDVLFAGLTFVPRSIANYGLRDMTLLESNSLTQREELARHIVEVINLFEPRLSNVEVVARDPIDVQGERPQTFRIAAMYFRIRATLNVDPIPIDGVTFDTVFELNTGHHNVFLPDSNV
jgi:type VI secretion system protein ImpF